MNGGNGGWESVPSALGFVLFHKLFTLVTMVNPGLHLGSHRSVRVDFSKTHPMGFGEFASAHPLIPATHDPRMLNDWELPAVYTQDGPICSPGHTPRHRYCWALNGLNHILLAVGF